VSNAELLLRLLAGALCWLTGAVLIVTVVAERRGPLTAAVLLVVGTTALTIGVVTPYVRATGREAAP
jgi:hypothetical protein